LLNYFASYLRDISTTITQVKTLAYTLINVPQPQSKPSPIRTDIASVMAACKKTYEDIRRIESIMRGHVKGRSI
jgi:hypothetical protein